MHDVRSKTPPGRDPVYLTLGGKRWRIDPLPPRAALRTSFRVIKLMGNAIGELFSGGGIELPGIRNEETGEPIRVSFVEILAAKNLQLALLAKLLGVLERLTPDDVLSLADELLVGQLYEDQAPGDQSPVFAIPLTTDEQVDDAVPDPFTLAGLMQRAFGASCLPFLPAGGTSDASSAGSTKTKPAGT